ncbi:hypothetical protein ACFSGI_19205 [Paenibacillus nicotianae]|uniref:Immunity protein 22 n=1 Tax=Paenibacillus nicotianae TaxID=1526551 RepID=A0ABW4UZV0_9BACL
MQIHLDELENTEVKAGICNIEFSSLEDIIFPVFIEWDECILLKQKGNADLPTHFSPDPFITDRTAFEAFYNHVHLNDLLEDVMQPNLVFKMAIKILEVWASVLYSQFNTQKRFVLILSYDGEGVTLRFYSIREIESSWLNISSLESYSDGLMVVEI